MEFGECFFAHAGAVGAEAAFVAAGTVATDPPVGHFVPSEPSFGVIKDAPVPDFVGFIIVEEVVDAAEGAQVFRGGGPAGGEGLDVVDFAAHGRHPAVGVLADEVRQDADEPVVGVGESFNGEDVVGPHNAVGVIIDGDCEPVFSYSTINQVFNRDDNTIGVDNGSINVGGVLPVGNNDAGALPKVSGIVGVFPVFDVFEFGEVITVEYPPY